MPSPTPKTKKGKKKNVKIVQDEASTSDVKPAADEGKEAMASENKAIPEESKSSKEAVPEITGCKEAKNETVTDKEQFHGFNDDEISESADMNLGENEDEDEDPVDLSAPFPADMNYCLGTSSLHIFTNYVTTNV